MCCFSWKKHGRSQSVLDSAHLSTLFEANPGQYFLVWIVLIEYLQTRSSIPYNWSLLYWTMNSFLKKTWRRVTCSLKKIIEYQYLHLEIARNFIVYLKYSYPFFFFFTSKFSKAISLGKGAEDISTLYVVSEQAEIWKQIEVGTICGQSHNLTCRAVAINAFLL